MLNDSSCTNGLKLTIQGHFLSLANSHKVNGVPVLPGAALCEVFLDQIRSCNETIYLDCCDFFSPVIPIAAFQGNSIYLSKKTNAQFDFYLPTTGLVASFNYTKKNYISKNSLELIVPDSFPINKINFYRRLSENGLNITAPLNLIVGAKETASKLIVKIKCPDISSSFGRICFLDTMFHGSLALHINTTKVMKCVKNLYLQASQLVSKKFVFCVYEKTGKETIKAVVFDENSDVLGSCLILTRNLINRPLHSVRLISDYTTSPIDKPLNFFNTLMNSSMNYSFSENTNVFEFLSRNENKEETFDTLLLCPEKMLGWNQISHSKENHPSISMNSEFYQLTLENGILIHGLNQYEIEYLYREIFLQKSYFDYINLPKKPRIIDIGANIGMFGLAAKDLYPGAEIISIEPIPLVYDALKLNYENFDVGKTYNYAISGTSGERKVRFYKNSSVFSHLIEADNNQDEALKVAISNSITTGLFDDRGNDKKSGLAEKFIETRLEHTDITCKVITLPELIEKEKILHIDLLKIDSEGSECDILFSLKDKHWLIIDSIVIEAHSESSRDAICKLLKNKGYFVNVSLYSELKGVNYFNVYASKFKLSTRTYNSMFLDQSIEKLQEGINIYQATKNKLPLLCFTSNSPSSNHPECLKHITVLKDKLITLSKNQGFDFLDFTNQTTDVAKHYNRLSFINARIPYTHDYWLIIAKGISRFLYNKFINKCKVICVDCDNTLWQGICSEQPIDELRISASNALLQRKLLQMKHQGTLIAVLSKNNIDYIRKAFSECRGMLIKEEDIAFWHVNWRSKAENVARLSKETGISLNSITHIDDNPVEIADLRINVPEVTSILLPPQEDSRLMFLNNLWVFDSHGKVTDEDIKRTQYYHQEQLRLIEKISFASNQEFIHSLGLEIDFNSLNEQHLNRASELSLRTNQFNNNKQGWQVHNIQKFISADDSYGFVISVKDMFGSYGIVSMVLSTFIKGDLHIKQWCMSCRVFDRGVEDKILIKLADFAEKIGAKSIVIAFKDDGENKKFSEFFSKILQINRARKENSEIYLLPENIKNTDFSTLANEYISSPYLESKAGVKAKKIGAINIEQIALYYSLSPEELKKLIYNDIEIKNPQTPVDTSIENIYTTLRTAWEYLFQQKIPSNDISFFEMGGKSIDLVQLANKINQLWKLDIPIYALYKNNTINLMAAYLASFFKEKENKA